MTTDLDRTQHRNTEQVPRQATFALPYNGTLGIPEVARRWPNVMGRGCPVCALCPVVHPISDCSPVADLISSGVVHMMVGYQKPVEAPGLSHQVALLGG